MTSNGNSCSAWRLYVIVDAAAARGRDLAQIAEHAIRGGADVIQLRAKAVSTRSLLEHAERLRRVTAGRVPLIINDRLDVALAVGADGVHLGQDDLPVGKARELLGRRPLIIGKSTHSLDQALEAEREATEYVAVGPVYATPTKPDYGNVGLELVRQAAAKLLKPIVAIGGIDASTLALVRHAGARCVAVVRAVCGADDPESAARSLKQALV